MLRAGEPILKPVYDHSNGTLARPDYVVPRDFVIIEGLLGFATQRMGDCFDIKVYLDPPEELRHRWKIKRDTSKRGYQAEQVVEEIKKREPDSRDFIRPQRASADVVVRFYPPNETPAGKSNGHLNVRLVLRPTVPHPDLSDVISASQPDRDGQPAAIRIELGRDAGRPVDFLEIDGGLNSKEAADLEGVISRHMPGTQEIHREMIGKYMDGLEQRQSDPLGLTQLFIIYHMLGAAQPGTVKEIVR